MSKTLIEAICPASLKFGPWARSFLSCWPHLLTALPSTSTSFRLGNKAPLPAHQPPNPEPKQLRTNPSSQMKKPSPGGKGLAQGRRTDKSEAGLRLRSVQLNPPPCPHCFSAHWFVWSWLFSGLQYTYVSSVLINAL